MDKSEKELPLLIEVKELARLKGYSFNLLNKTIPSAAGYHAVDRYKKTIEIGVEFGHSEYISILVHELLHAKLFLTGFPKLSLHSNHRFGSADNALLEIENIAHHTLIYKEMGKLGYACKAIDEHYLEGVISDNDKVFQGGSKVNRALRLMEGFLRRPDIIKQYESEIKNKQNMDYQLFQTLKSYYGRTSTPFEMRKSLVKVLRTVNSFVRNIDKVDFYLNYFVRLEPYFTKQQLSQKSFQIIKHVRFNEYAETFLVTREDDQCFFFMAPIFLSPDRVESTIKSLKLKDFLIAYNIPYMEV